MNEVLKAIKERRSIRKFKPDMVPKELIDQIIEAGIYAPSAKDLQDVIIVAVTNKEIRDKLSAWNAEIAGRSVDPFYGGPVVLVVLAKADEPNHLYDGPLVLQNMMLAAHSLGLGSIWIHRAKEEFEKPEGKELLNSLGVEGEYEGIGHCVIGYMDGPAPAEHPRKPNRVFYVE